MSSSLVSSVRARRDGEVLMERAENICDREDIVEANIRSVKISSPDVRRFVRFPGGRH